MSEPLDPDEYIAHMKRRAEADPKYVMTEAEIDAALDSFRRARFIEVHRDQYEAWLASIRKKS